MRTKQLILLAMVLVSCTTREMKTIGEIERADPELDALISPDAVIEIIGEGFTWSEGPVWIEPEKMLLFTDVPENKIYKWTEVGGVELYLTPSGFTGETTRSREPGANGLQFHNNALILCQHGNRQVAQMNAPLSNPQPDFITLAGTFNNQRFNSPNDLALRSNGDIFFTDPPYGLADQDKDADKEIPANGVYKLTPDGSVTQLLDTLTRPNGIAFMPGEKKFIVANSDPAKARWYLFELSDDAKVVAGKIFYDATDKVGKEKGLPDGLKIDSRGNVYATGPGGVWIFNADGRVIGKIKLPEASANCALSPDEKTLYITCDMYLLRVKLRK
jgi:gluconolactonase